MPVATKKSPKAKAVVAPVRQASRKAWAKKKLAAARSIKAATKSAPKTKVNRLWSEADAQFFGPYFDRLAINRN